MHTRQLACSATCIATKQKSKLFRDFIWKSWFTACKMPASSPNHRQLSVPAVHTMLEDGRRDNRAGPTAHAAAFVSACETFFHKKSRRASG